MVKEGPCQNLTAPIPLTVQALYSEEGQIPMPVMTLKGLAPCPDSRSDPRVLKMQSLRSRCEATILSVLFQSEGLDNCICITTCYEIWLLQLWAEGHFLFIQCEFGFLCFITCAGISRDFDHDTRSHLAMWMYLMASTIQFFPKPVETMKHFHVYIHSIVSMANRRLGKLGNARNL